MVLALLLVYARIHANETMTFNFIFRARAKYIAAGFLLFYLIIDFYTGRRFDAFGSGAQGGLGEFEILQCLLHLQADLLLLQ